MSAASESTIVGASAKPASRLRLAVRVLMAILFVSLSISTAVLG